MRKWSCIHLEVSLDRAGAWALGSLGRWGPGTLGACWPLKPKVYKTPKFPDPPSAPAPPNFRHIHLCGFASPLFLSVEEGATKYSKMNCSFEMDNKKTICWHLFAIFMKYISKSIAGKLCGMVLPRLGVITIWSYYLKDRKLNISWFPNFWAPGDPYEWNWTYQLTLKEICDNNIIWEHIFYISINLKMLDVMFSKLLEKVFRKIPKFPLMKSWIFWIWYQYLPENMRCFL